MIICYYISIRGITLILWCISIFLKTISFHIAYSEYHNTYVSFIENRAQAIFLADVNIFVRCFFIPPRNLKYIHHKRLYQQIHQYCKAHLFYDGVIFNACGVMIYSLIAPWLLRFSLLCISYLYLIIGWAYVRHIINKYYFYMSSNKTQFFVNGFSLYPIDNLALLCIIPILYITLLG